jgi:hypothetical protein
VFSAARSFHGNGRDSTLGIVGAALQALGNPARLIVAAETRGPSMTARSPDAARVDHFANPKPLAPPCLLPQSEGSRPHTGVEPPSTEREASRGGFLAQHGLTSPAVEILSPAH